MIKVPKWRLNCFPGVECHSQEMSSSCRTVIIFDSTQPFRHLELTCKTILERNTGIVEEYTQVLNACSKIACDVLGMQNRWCTEWRTWKENEKKPPSNLAIPFPPCTVTRGMLLICSPSPRSLSYIDGRTLLDLQGSTDSVENRIPVRGAVKLQGPYLPFWQIYKTRTNLKWLCRRLLWTKLRSQYFLLFFSPAAFKLTHPVAYE